MGYAVDKRANPGTAIGFTVAGIITTTGNITGASINPARTFGLYLGDLVLGVIIRGTISQYSLSDQL